MVMRKNAPVAIAMLATSILQVATPADGGCLRTPVGEQARPAASSEELLAADRRAAEQGNADAQFRAGVRSFSSGANAEAVRWFAKAAAQGLAPAQYRLALLYMSGTGVAQDDREAVAWLRRAAEGGHRDAMMNLAGMILHGRGPQTAIQEFRSSDVAGIRAANNKAVAVTGTVSRVERFKTFPESTSYILNIYFAETTEVSVGCGSIPEQIDEKIGGDAVIGKRITVTLQRLRVLPSGPIKLGVDRLNEIRVEGSNHAIPEAEARRLRASASRDEAVKWLSKAGELGAVRAYTWMGLAYTQEYVQSYNYVEAARWFREAAQRDDDWAKLLLADLYVQGRGVPESPDHARPLYVQAAASTEPYIATRAKQGLQRVGTAKLSSDSGAIWLALGAAVLAYAWFAPQIGGSSADVPASVSRATLETLEQSRCVLKGGVWKAWGCMCGNPNGMSWTC